MLFALLLACGGPRDPAVERPVDIPTEVAPVPDPRKPPPDDAALLAPLQRIRDAEPPCYGPSSRIDVWRTPKGEVHRLFYHGSMDCSHPPSVWFDPDGKELETVPMEPVTGENRDHYEAIWARHTTGAEKAENVRALAPTGE